MNWNNNKAVMGRGRIGVAIDGEQDWFQVEPRLPVHSYEMFEINFHYLVGCIHTYIQESTIGGLVSSPAVLVLLSAGGGAMGYH